MTNKNKRGELTSRQLIIIIILIISFGIIIAFFFMLDLGGEIDKESCRNSVMMRGIFSKIPVVGRGFISLKCKTQDVCLSMGGDCEEEVDDTIKVEDKNKLIKEMVNLLADCWWMMGEGKVDYDDKGSCAICYKVYFDDEIKAKIGSEISYKDLYQYMKENKVSNSNNNYFYYLYGGNDEDNLKKGAINPKIKEGYAIATSIPREEGLIEWVESWFKEGKQVPPVLVRFSSKDLGELGCSKFVTEV